MDLMALVARLTLDKTNYDQGLDDASKGAQSFGDKLKNGLGTAAKVGAAAIAAVGTAAAAATKVLVQQAGEVAAYGDNIDKASQKLGISAEAYQEWDAVLQHSGTSIDSMGIGMKTLATAAASGAEEFQKLGISQKEAASMSREELFSRTITALQNVTDENKRAQLAQKLFGRSAMELGPLLNTSAADTQAMKDRVHELGGVMSNEAVKAAAAYQDNLQDMQTAISGVKRSIVQEFIPGLSDLMNGLATAFSGDYGGDAIYDGIYSIVEGAGRAIDKIVDIGHNVIPQLVDAVLDGLPLLMDGMTDLVWVLGEAILENLPSLVRAGLQIIITLANSISQNLPELIPTIVDVVLEIVNILTEPSTLGALVDAAIAIIIALAEGLIDAMPKLLEKAPVIVAQLVAAIITNAPKLLGAAVQLMATFAQGIVQNIFAVINAIGQMWNSIVSSITGFIQSAWNWGKDLIESFTNGIKAFISKPIDAIKGLASKIKAFLGFSEPDEGPLANFHTYAPDMMALFAKGITDNQGLITDAIAGAFDLQPQIAANVNDSATGHEFTVQRVGGASSVQAATMEIDRAVFARLIFKLYNEEAGRVGVNLAGVNI